MRGSLKEGVSALAVAAALAAAPALAADVFVEEPIAAPIEIVEPVVASRFYIAPEVAAVFFDVPEISNGLLVDAERGRLDLSSDLDDWGYSLGLTAGMHVGQVGGRAVRLEAHGFYAGMDASSSVTGQTDFGAFAVTGLTAGGGEATARAEVDGRAAAAQSTAVVVDSTGDRGFLFSKNVAAGGGFTGTGAVTPIERGAASVFTQARSDAPAATAFSTAFSDLGFAFAAAGDLNGLTVRNNYESDLRYWGAEFRFVTDALTTETWAVSPFAGPIYRLFERDFQTTTEIAVVEPDPLFRGAAPDAVLRLNEEVEAGYFGGIIGVGVIGRITQGVGIEMSVSGALMQLWADYDGRETGIIDLPFQEPQSFAGPHISDSASEQAFLGRAKGSIWFDMGFAVLSLGGQVEHLSDVPTIRRDPPAAASASIAGEQRQAQAQAGNLDGVGATTSLDFDDMTAYSIDARLTVRF